MLQIVVVDATIIHRGIVVEILMDDEAFKDTISLCPRAFDASSLSNIMPVCVPFRMVNCFTFVSVHSDLLISKSLLT